MNKFILTVQGYLLYPENYTKERLEQNYRDAAYAAADYIVYFACVAACVADAYYAEYWLNEYFEITGENRQDYIDLINRGK